MRQLLFSIRDMKTEVFSAPMAFPTAGAAVRAFADECNNPDSMISKHPEDFSFFRVGSFDVDKGLMIPEEHGAVIIGNGLEYRNIPEIAGVSR